MGVTRYTRERELWLGLFSESEVRIALIARPLSNVLDLHLYTSYTDVLSDML